MVSIWCIPSLLRYPLSFDWRPKLRALALAGGLLGLAACGPVMRSDRMNEQAGTLPPLATGLRRWHLHVPVKTDESNWTVRLIARTWEAESCNDAPYRAQWIPIAPSGPTVRFFVLHVERPQPRPGMLAPCPMNPPAWHEAQGRLTLPYDSQHDWVVDAPSAWSLSFEFELTVRNSR